jgi:hypothetical protein
MAEKATETMKRAGEGGAETVAEAGRHGARALRGASETAAQGFEEAITLGRENLETMAKSARAVSDGLLRLNEEWLGFLEQQFRDGLEAGQALARCRSVPEMVRVQGEYACSALDRLATETSTLTDIAARMVSEGLQPLQIKAERGTGGLAERPQA